MQTNEQKIVNVENSARSFSRKAISGTSGSVPFSRNVPNRDETGSKKFPKFPNREVSGSCGTPVLPAFAVGCIPPANGNGPGQFGKAEPSNPVDRDGWRPALAETEAAPGWVFRPVGKRLLVAFTPWPEYGASGSAWWPAKVVRCFDGKDPTRRYWLGWSARLSRWTASNDASRLRRDLTADELLELDSHVLDVLEGSLC